MCSPRLFPALWAIQAQQTLTQGLGYFAVDVPKPRTQTGKQHKAQEEEEVYSCPQKSQRGPFLSELPHPLGKHKLICKSAQSPLGVRTSG